MADLKAPHGPLTYFLDLHPDIGDFRRDAIEGLSHAQKSLSPKYFYDAAGSQLFNQITQLKEYYLPSTEHKIFTRYSDEIGAAIGEGAAVLEYGSGSSEKVDWLFDALKTTTAYVAVDISKDHLIASSSAIANANAFPVAAICADFHTPINLPQDYFSNRQQWLGYFPGSTLGNLAPADALAFFNNAAKTLGAGAQFLLGVDLEKDEKILNTAYNDAAGVTAAFNLNLLYRMRRELDADISVEDFEHHAFYNARETRIEMHLRARVATDIVIDAMSFHFEAGETLHTENSYKYSRARLADLLRETPWKLDKIWTDQQGWYAACLLSHR